MLFRHLFTVFVGSSAAAAALGAAVACSSDSSSSPVDPGGNEAGSTSGDVPDASVPDVQVTNPNETKQTGHIIDAVSKFGVTSPTITIAGKSVTGDTEGNYAIIVPKNTPYTMSITDDGEHWKLNEQEWIVKLDLLERGDTALLSTSIAGVLATLLPPRDTAKGILVVKVNALPPCASEEGAVISIANAPDAKVTYFVNGKPDQTATSTKAGESFSAAITDVDPGVNVTVTVLAPTCEQVPFPIDYQNVTYTGVQKTEAGDVLSYYRVFIGPTKMIDAGGD